MGKINGTCRVHWGLRRRQKGNIKVDLQIWDRLD